MVVDLAKLVLVSGIVAGTCESACPPLRRLLCSRLMVPQPH